MNENKVKTYCNECFRETNHEIKGDYSKKEWDSYGSHNDESFHQIWIEYTWQIVECMGCETVSARFEEIFSEVDGISEKRYPALIARRKPEWVIDIEDETLEVLFDELYIAYAANALFLSTMACRTIIERIMTLKSKSDGSFKKRLTDLERLKLITESDKGLVETALEAGHASAHRGWSPRETKTMDIVIGIIENLVEKLFILPKLSGELSKQIPKRKPKV